MTHIGPHEGPVWALCDPMEAWCSACGTPWRSVVAPRQSRPCGPMKALRGPCAAPSSPEAHRCSVSVEIHVARVRSMADELEMHVAQAIGLTVPLKMHAARARTDELEMHCAVPSRVPYGPVQPPARSLLACAIPRGSTMCTCQALCSAHSRVPVGPVQPPARSLLALCNPRVSTVCTCGSL